MGRMMTLLTDDVRALENALWSHFEAFENQPEGDQAMALYRFISEVPGEEGPVQLDIEGDQVELMDRALTRWVGKFNPAERQETVAKLNSTLGKVRAALPQPL